MKLVISLISVTLITACSGNKPSESDLKKELVRSFESCKYASVENLKKINGEAIPGENLYYVDAKFEIKFNPLPDADEYKEKLAEFNTEYTALKDQHDSLYKERYDGMNSYSFYESKRSQVFKKYFVTSNQPTEEKEHFAQLEAEEYATINEQQKREDEEMSALLDKAREMGEKSNALTRMAAHEYAKNCKLDQWASKLINGYRFVDFDFSRKNMFGNVYKYEGKIPMKKTENGWVINK